MAKAKITITGSGKSDAYTPYAFLYINNTVYASAGVVEVELGTVCQCRVGRGTSGIVAVLLDGNKVKEVTDTYGEAIYELEVNRNYTIDLAVATGAIITITTGEEVTPDDPMAPYDGHNTNIGSMAREIEGGTVKMNGVARELESGLVLVSGVAREISFGGGTVVITITGNGGNYANVQINGRTYTSAMVVEVETGTEAVFSATSQNGITRNITLNGTVVASNSTSSPVTYTMEVIENITVELKYERVVANTYRGVVNITTE